MMLPLEIVPNDLSSVAREQRALDLLKLVGLAGFEDKKPRNYLEVCVNEHHCAEHWFTNRKY